MRLIKKGNYLEKMLIEQIIEFELKRPGNSGRIRTPKTESF